MKRINSMVWGSVLLLVGAVLTLNQVGVLSFGNNMALPIILLSLSVVFHLYYFLSRGGNEGLLVPGGILLVYGLLFLSVFQLNCSFSQMWPLFILGPAVGLFELYAFSRGARGSMIPVFILTAIGGGFLLMTFGVANWNIVIALLLICIGGAMMISAFLRADHRRQEAAQPHVEVHMHDVPPSGGEKKVEPEPEQDTAQDASGLDGQP